MEHLVTAMPADGLSLEEEIENVALSFIDNA